VTYLEVFQAVQLEMAPLFFFGLMSGTTTCSRINFPDYIHMQKTKKSQLQNFLQVTRWILNSTYLYLNKLIRNT